MLSLAFILAITGISIYISCSMSHQVTWFEYYKGGVIGLFISGLLLQIWNKRKRNHGMGKNRHHHEED
jgi:hypothetical protein